MRARLHALLACAIACATLPACGSAIALPPPPQSPPPVPWPAPLTAGELPQTTPDAPFREHVPEAGPAVVFKAPVIESFALKNGTRVLFTPRPELPVISVRVVARAGAGDFAGERPGLFAFMGAMLEQGTSARSALAISDAYEAMGASHAAWVDWDAGQATVKVLASQLDAALDVLADITKNAAFPQAEIDRLKGRWLAAIQAEKQSPGTMASNALAASLFGRTHAYGHSLLGKEEDAKAITRDEIVRAYARTFTPLNVTIVIAGDVTREALAPKLEAAFGAWRGAAPVARAAAASAAKVGSAASAAKAAGAGSSARLVIVDRPGAPQAQVLVADTGVAAGAPDRDAIAVMNAILGGMFSSRINLNLREAHAYTYDARSRFALRHGAGPFTAGGAVASDKTAAATAELLREIAAMRDNAVSAEELADAKEHLKLAMPGRFETVGDVTSALADLAIYDLPLDEYKARPARIEGVTIADVKRAAQAHLRPAKLKVIVVGDRGALEPAFAPLHLGALEARDAYGDVIGGGGAGESKPAKQAK